MGADAGVVTMIGETETVACTLESTPEQAQFWTKSHPEVYLAAEANRHDKQKLVHNFNIKPR